MHGLLRVELPIIFRGDCMRIKSNTLFSDAELRKIRETFIYDENPDAMLFRLFPHVHHRIEGDTIYMGAPPWDITQEIEL